MVKCDWQGKPEVLREKRDTVPLCTSQNSQNMTWDRTCILFKVCPSQLTNMGYKSQSIFLEIKYLQENKDTAVLVYNQ
jgi:hypothetical protein